MYEENIINNFPFIVSAKDGVVLATENSDSTLFDFQSKIEQISQHIGCVYRFEMF